MKDLIAKLRHSEYIHYSLTFLATFLLSVHYILVVYTNSSFLAQFASDKALGILYVLGSCLTILILLSASYILEHVGNRKMMLGFIYIEAAALLTMGFSGNALASILAFIVEQGVAYVLLFNLDIFLESDMIKRSHIGSARGMFLTMTNVAYVAIPSLVGLLLVSNEYWKVYGLSALVLIPLFILIYQKFRTFKDPTYKHLDHFKNFRLYFRNDKLARVFRIDFALQFFYAAMTIYMPLYLHAHIGFAWPTIGAMFSVMLMPFVIFQVPGGFLADRDGEHGYLVGGLLILGGATIAFSFMNSESALAWTAILFLSRVGASIVEIMAESFFFKHVQGKDAGFISVFRMASPLSYITAPLALGLLLALGGFKLVFFCLGVFILWTLLQTVGI